MPVLRVLVTLLRTREKPTRKRQRQDLAVGMNIYETAKTSDCPQATSRFLSAVSVTPLRENGESVERPLKGNALRRATTACQNSAKSSARAGSGSTQPCLRTLRFFFHLDATTLQSMTQLLKHHCLHERECGGRGNTFFFKNISKVKHSENSDFELRVRR